MQFNTWVTQSLKRKPHPSGTDTVVFLSGAYSTLPSTQHPGSQQSWELLYDPSWLPKHSVCDAFPLLRSFLQRWKPGRCLINMVMKNNNIIWSPTVKPRKWAQLRNISKSAASFNKTGDVCDDLFTMPSNQQYFPSVAQTANLKERIPQTGEGIFKNTEEDMVHGHQLPSIRRKQKIFQKLQYIPSNTPRGCTQL